MWNKLNLARKIILSIAVALILTSLLGFWFTERRINRQAGDAFRDKVRQITGMASATRVWYSRNIDSFVANNDFKHIQQVPVVLAWSVAQEYASSAGMEFKTPSLHPRNPKNAADDFERRALQKFEQEPQLKDYSERVVESGREWMRFAEPVRVTKDCLFCHGDPAGSKDPFGYAREGMKEGDLRAAFSVRVPADDLVANAAGNSRALLLTNLIALIAAAWQSCGSHATPLRGRSKRSKPSCSALPREISPIVWRLRLRMPAQTVDATPSNALIRQGFSEGSGLFGYSRSKT